MSDGIFTLAKASAKYLAENNDVHVLLLKAHETESALVKHDDVAALLAAAGNTEADFTSYSRQTSLSPTVQVDDDNDRVSLALPDLTFGSAGGTTDNSLVKLIVAAQTGGTDSTLVPISHHDVSITTDGSDLTLASGDWFLRVASTNTAQPISIGAVPSLDTWETKILEDEDVDEVAQGWADGSYSAIAVYDTNYCWRYLQEYFGAKALWESARTTWRDTYEAYIDDNDGQVIQYGLYPQGLYDDYTKDGRDAALSLLQRVADKAWQTYQDSDDEVGQTRNWHTVRAREAAYGLLTLLLYEQAVGRDNMVLASRGGPTDMSDPDNRFKLVLHKIEYHMRQWSTQDWTNVPDGVATDDEDRLRVFMFGLSSHALSRYHEIHGDRDWTGTYWTNIADALTETAAYIRETAETRDGNNDSMWIADFDGNGNGVFRYGDISTEFGGTGGTEDLNNLIAPTYMYVALLTGDSKYVTYADDLFKGHVEIFGIWNTAYKQTNQMHFILPDYFRWREEFAETYG